MKIKFHVYKKFWHSFGLHQKAGISLVELLIAVAMIGGVALTVAELMRQSGQVTSKTRTRYDESEFLTILHNKLMQPSICEKNFPVGSAAAKASFTNNELLDVDNTVIAKVGTQYGENRDLTLSSISSEYVPNSSWIKVVFEFTKAKTTNLAPLIIERRLALFAEVDNNGKVERCLGSTLSVEDSLWDLACSANTLDGNNRDVMVTITDPDDPTQTICVKKNLNPEGCGLVASDVANSFNYNSSSKLYDFSCVNGLKATICPMNFFMRYSSDGSAVCFPISQLQAYQPFNETNDSGVLVSGPSVLDCTGRNYVGLQEINDRIRVMCDTVVANTPTPTPSPTATNTPTATPTKGSCSGCATRPSTYTFSISPSQIPDNKTTHFGIYLVDNCDGDPVYTTTCGANTCDSVLNCVGEKGPICGIFITNLGGPSGSYTVTSAHLSGIGSIYAGSTDPNAATAAVLSCTTSPALWSGALSSSDAIDLSVDLAAFNNPFAVSDPSIYCYVGSGVTFYGALWRTTCGGYDVASPSVYSGINGANFSCMSPK